MKVTDLLLRPSRFFFFPQRTALPALSLSFPLFFPCKLTPTETCKTPFFFKFFSLPSILPTSHFFPLFSLSLSIEHSKTPSLISFSLFFPFFFFLVLASNPLQPLLLLPFFFLLPPSLFCLQRNLPLPGFFFFFYLVLPQNQAAKTPPPCCPFFPETPIETPVTSLYLSLFSSLSPCFFSPGFLFFSCLFETPPLHFSLPANEGLSPETDYPLFSPSSSPSSSLQTLPSPPPISLFFGKASQPSLQTLVNPPLSLSLFFFLRFHLCPSCSIVYDGNIANSKVLKNINL